MYLYGASGHGKVIKDILEAQGRKVDGFIDDNPNVNELAGLPVLHSAEKVDEVIVSIGVNGIRKKVVEKLDCKMADAAVHPSAVVADTVSIEKGTVVMVGAVVNPDAKIGKHCIVNTGATVDHECVIDHIFPMHLVGKDDGYREAVNAMWNFQPVKGEVNNLKSNIHPRDFFQDMAKDSQGNVIQGSKYFSDYDFVPELTSDLWDRPSEFIVWRRTQMLEYMESHYGIKVAYGE